MNHTDKIISLLFEKAIIDSKDINYALHLKGIAPYQVAKECNASPEMIYMTISGNTTSYNIATFISSSLNVPLKKLWPDGRYNRPPRRGRPAKRKAA